MKLVLFFQKEENAGSFPIQTNSSKGFGPTWRVLKAFQQLPAGSMPASRTSRAPPLTAEKLAFFCKPKIVTIMAALINTLHPVARPATLSAGAFRPSARAARFTPVIRMVSPATHRSLRSRQSRGFRSPGSFQLPTGFRCIFLSFITLIWDLQGKNN